MSTTSGELAFTVVSVAELGPVDAHVVFGRRHERQVDKAAPVGPGVQYYALGREGSSRPRNIHTGARQQRDPSGFEAALRSLTRELSAPGTPLANYQRYRQALENWAVDEPTRDGLLARLLTAALARTPDLGDRKRQAASVFAWSASPSANPASPPPHRGRPAPGRPGTVATALEPHLVEPADPGQPRQHIYSRLRAEIDALATVLATTIDPSHPADTTLGAAPLYVSRYPRRLRKPRAPTVAIHL